MEKFRNYIWAIYAFLFIVGVSTNTLCAYVFLFLTIWYLPPLKKATDSLWDAIITHLKAQKEKEGKELDTGKASLIAKVIVGVIAFISIGIPLPADKQQQTAQQPAKQQAPAVEEKKTYTPEQIKASKDLIDGLKSSEVGLILKMYEGDKGYWRVIIDENVWNNLLYENKKQMLVALKIYIENVENGTVKAIWGLGGHDNLLYFSEDSIYSEPRKIL